MNLNFLLQLTLEEFKRQTRFTSKCPPKEIVRKIEEAAKPLGFDVQKKNYKVPTRNSDNLLFEYFLEGMTS